MIQTSFVTKSECKTLRPPIHSRLRTQRGKMDALLLRTEPGLSLCDPLNGLAVIFFCLKRHKIEVKRGRYWLKKTSASFTPLAHTSSSQMYRNLTMHFSQSQTRLLNSCFLFILHSLVRMSTVSENSYLFNKKHSWYHIEVHLVKQHADTTGLNLQHTFSLCFPHHFNPSYLRRLLFRSCLTRAIVQNSVH